MKTKIFIVMGLLLSSSAVLGSNGCLQQHLEQGVKCEACHGATSKPSQPAESACVTCHGDIDKMTGKTKEMAPNNAHINHLGESDCTQCHGVHKGKSLPCEECHQFKFQMKSRS
ncbi:cytochrome c3 family protein [Parasutterella excrementihominis]|uniref:cytochrome c3 family protein n=1 Tax=Parasutterella excrementihominis TaxID=487175 RepID=UPI0030780682